MARIQARESAKVPRRGTRVLEHYLPVDQNLSPDLTDIVTSKVFNLNVTPEKDDTHPPRLRGREKLHLPKWELGTPPPRV